MLNLFKLLLFLINVDQKTVFDWFGIKNINTQNFFLQGFDKK